MPLRPGRILKQYKRPWTRVSKSKPRKSYVVGVPQPHIHTFEMGDKNGVFDSCAYLTPKADVSIRDNALESARIVAQNFLEKKLGPTGYFLKVLVYPHGVIREHSIAQGAGADRFSQGMRHNFGRPVGIMANVSKGQHVFMLKFNKASLPTVKDALKRAGSKIRMGQGIEIAS
ncbi:MAG: 50S ribosomal protein L16 [Candidatus Aenigmarchaeota archaeon]|nr:50S ribosomal protein L16 [Candidatus Aenigmarchaeota archaeon]